MFVRWPGHIKPGTIKNKLFASLEWVPDAGRLIQSISAAKIQPKRLPRKLYP
jgi:hypothetical protein